MTTLVLERDDAIVAYACCGKGADLAGHWHELGGSDRYVAELLRAALHFTDQIEAVLLRHAGVRFASPVFNGQPLVVQGWERGNDVWALRTVGLDGRPVITNGLVRFG